MSTIVCENVTAWSTLFFVMRLTLWLSQFVICQISFDFFTFYNIWLRDSFVENGKCCESFIYAIICYKMRKNNEICGQFIC